MSEIRRPGYQQQDYWSGYAECFEYIIILQVSHKSLLERAILNEWLGKNIWMESVKTTSMWIRVPVYYVTIKSFFETRK